MLVYALEWSAIDVLGTDDDDETDTDTFEIRMYGRTETDVTACIRISFPPYFFVKTPDWSPARQRAFVYDCVNTYGADETYSMPVKRIDAWGYSGGRQEDFIQVAFRTLKAARIAKYRLSKKGMDMYEGSVDPIVRLCHVRSISPSGWVLIDRETPVVSEEDRCAPRCDIEVRVPFTGIGPLDEPRPPPRIVLCSWDIECVSDLGNFPNASLPEDKIIQIACAFQRLGDPTPYLKTVVVLDTCDPVPDVEIISVASEADVVVSWMDLLAREHVDVMLGWNTWQFDWKYVRGRLGVLTDASGHGVVDIGMLGRGPEGAGDPREWDLNSGAYGQNSFFTLKAPGILDLDVMQLVRRDFKLDSYSLNNVSKKYLDGDGKVDLPAGELFERFRGSSADRAVIAAYAVQDVLLPLRLMAKLSMFDNLTQMSVATCVPIDYLLSRGQQIKVFSLILRQARSMGYLLPDDKGITIDGKYEGATVLDAKRGAYFDVISGLDFASLYPSIIRAHRMCYSTLMIPSSPVPPATYVVETGLGTYAFAQDPATPGIVPELLKNLAVWRKDAKTKMAACAAAGDTWGASVWNGAQLAFKISMNSVYGFLGASKGFLPCVPIAASVTATGQTHGLLLLMASRMDSRMFFSCRSSDD